MFVPTVEIPNCFEIMFPSPVNISAQFCGSGVESTFSMPMKQTPMMETMRKVLTKDMMRLMMEKIGACCFYIKRNFHVFNDTCLKHHVLFSVHSLVRYLRKQNFIYQLFSFI